jgi:hypothetical protein
MSVDGSRLAEAVCGLAVDLRTARRDCHDKQQQIDSLQAGNARLLAAAHGDYASALACGNASFLWPVEPSQREGLGWDR